MPHLLRELGETLRRVSARRAYSFVLMAGLGLAVGLIQTHLAGASIPETFSSRPADAREAELVLGRTLPEPSFLPLGLVLSGIGVDPSEQPSPRKVWTAYATGGRNVIGLSLFRGEVQAIRFQQTMTVRGSLVWIERHPIGNDEDAISYIWNRDGIAYTLTVLTASGLDRTLGDQIVASIP